MELLAVVRISLKQSKNWHATTGVAEVNFDWSGACNRSNEGGDG